jgi:hypothetical protein
VDEAIAVAVDVEDALDGDGLLGVIPLAPATPAA